MLGKFFALSQCCNSQIDGEHFIALLISVGKPFVSKYFYVHVHYFQLLPFQTRLGIDPFLSNP